ADQFDGGPQLGAANVLVDADFVSIQAREIDSRRNLGPRRRPHFGRDASASIARAGQLHCCNVDLQLRTDADLRFGVIVVRQHALVELLRDERRPRMVEALPATWAMQRRVEVVEEGHRSPMTAILQCSCWLSTTVTSPGPIAA